MKRTNAKILSLLLRKIAKEIEQLSDLELQELADSSAPLISKRPESSSGEKSAPAKESEVDSTSILNVLKDMKSREEGATYLASVATTKGQLSVIAKALDLPVGKRNSHEEIAGKIIEATIGFRIRSAAIRGGHEEPRQERGDPTSIEPRHERDDPTSIEPKHHPESDSSLEKGNDEKQEKTEGRESAEGTGRT